MVCNYIGRGLGIGIVMGPSMENNMDRKGVLEEDQF